MKFWEIFKNIQNLHVEHIQKMNEKKQNLYLGRKFLEFAAEKSNSKFKKRIICEGEREEAGDVQMRPLAL